MKKLILTLVAVVLTAMTTYAQNRYVATLTHEGNVRTFYGINALVEANAAAEEGDIITLSSGKFNGTTITRAITLRGAGMEDVVEQNIQKTEITSTMTIRLEEGQSHSLLVENLELLNAYSKTMEFRNCRNAIFKKCNIPSDCRFSGGSVENVNFIQCRINYMWHSYDASVAYINCCIENEPSIEGNGVSFLNCTISCHNYGNLGSGALVNSVLIASYSWASTPATCTLVNCLGYSHNSITLGGSLQNCITLTGESILKEDSFYELTDEAKAALSGTDGTEVGMYGGQYPYNPLPDGPRITRFNVASKSSADNKLSVDIEVSGGE